MLFWTWAKGLEDHFDRVSRRWLDGFIVPEGAGHMFEESEMRNETEMVQYAEVDSNSILYYVSPPGLDSVGEVEERRALTRLPIFAIFHGIAPKYGIPPSFTRFIRQWPALPRFGIFLTVYVLPMTHVKSGDRYQVGSIESLPGFYGVFECRGFRDEPAFDIDEIVMKIHELETRRGSDGTERITRLLMDHLRRPTHVVPHYAVRSRGVNHTSRELRSSRSH